MEAAAEVEEREEVEDMVDCLEVEAGLEVAKERQAKECQAVAKECQAVEAGLE